LPDKTRIGEQAETAAAADAAPDVTRAGAAPPPDTVAPPPETQAAPPETQAPPPETQAPPPETQAPPPETQAPPPETVAPAPGETRIAPGETEVGAVPGETRLGPAETRLGAAPQETAAAAAAPVGPTVAGAPTAPPPTTPPPPSRARERGTPAPVFAALGIGALIALVLGFVVGHSGGGSSEPAGSKTQAAGALDLAVPSDWTKSASPAQVPGIDFGDDALTVSPSGGAEQGTLTVGVTDAKGSTLLPASFVSKLSSKPQPTDGVSLGEIEALRYKGLKPKGFSDQLTLYAAPTTEGVATVACAAPAAKATSFLPECEKVSASLTLGSGKPYPLGTDDDYESDLSDTMGSLNSARTSGVSKLKSAKSGSSQASAANSIASAYASAAGTLKDADVSPQFADSNSALVTAMTKTESAYKNLASAAKRGSSSSYNKARKQVSKGEAAVQRALDSLKSS
jgi:hypothetical protein